MPAACSFLTDLFVSLRPQAAFTEWEDAVIVRGHEELGKKWALISKMLVGRTDNAVKNRWNGLFCRRLSTVIRSNKYLCSGAPLKAVLQQGLQGSHRESAQASEQMDSGRSQDTGFVAGASPPRARGTRLSEACSGTSTYVTAEELLDTYSGTAAVHAPNPDYRRYTAREHSRHSLLDGSLGSFASYNLPEPQGLAYGGSGWVQASTFSTELSFSNTAAPFMFPNL